MRLRRLKAIAVKEVLQIWRDPRSLMIALLMPFTQMFLLGYGVSLDLKHIPVCTFDREASQNSQALLKQFRGVALFRHRPQRARPIRQLVDGDRPRRLQDRHRHPARLLRAPERYRQRRSVQAILDATDDNTANIAFGYALAVVSGYSSDVAARRAGPAGPSAPADPAR